MANKKTTKIEEKKEETKEASTEVKTKPMEIIPELPKAITRAIALNRGRGGWQVTLFEIEGDKIVSKQTTEPEIKQIAVEQFKIAAAKNFIMKD